MGTRRALEIGDYPQAVFYAQQCVEKAVKAMLEVEKRVVYSRGSELVGIFVEVFERVGGRVQHCCRGS